jgi:lipopolysaccharide transport system permease protein
MSVNYDEVVLRPGKGVAHYWRDLWSYRELLYFLAWRDVTVRYKQTAIGIAWSIIRPLLTMIIFTVVFGRIAHLPSAGVPYPVLVLSGLLPWTFFSTAVGESANSLITNQSMVSKTYFPRLMLPASSIAVAMIDFLIALALLIPLMIWFHMLPTWRLIALPIFLVLSLLVSFGAGVWLSALNVKYRDFRYVVPFVLQLGLYISPVGFSSAIIASKWRPLFSLNPLVGIIDGFRWCILGKGNSLDYESLLLSIVVGFLLLAGGLRYFLNTERTFADVI